MMDDSTNNMINQDHINLLESLKKLELAGFTDQIMYRDNTLVNLTKGVVYENCQVILAEEFRFEGMTDPGDESILFALAFTDQNKGTLAALYGPQGDAELFTFMNNLDCRKKPKNSKV